MTAASPLAGLRVLIVEDETMLSLMLADMLEDFGCVVAATATHLPAATHLAETADMNLAIFDLNLNGVSSKPAAEAALARGVPVLFATGYNDAVLPDHLRLCPVLPKPYTPQDLEKAMIAALAGRK